MEQSAIHQKSVITQWGLIVAWASLLLYSLMISGCQSKASEESQQQSTDKVKKTTESPLRIVSLNGTITEVLCALGYEQNIVGVDVTSTYPRAINKLPKIGHTRNMQAEGIISLKPSLILGKTEELKPELIQQLKATKVDLELFKLDYSVQGAKQLIKDIAQKLPPTNGVAIETLIKQIDQSLAKLEKLPNTPKVLFIYARGAGTLMVAGKNTPVQKIIEMAGGQNAINDFDNFKPLTAEALVKANPEVILMFESGLKSLDEGKGLLKVPGVANTNAGRNKAYVAMDGQLLTGFSPRLGQAVYTLNQKLKATLATQ
ncbi:hemin ABC transporter substrate-binding protein [uncultured Microscilla sp.]|uniref:heme/hemin ABC transporter substrate-binding protein n=1 Tax=uncultured Microscilla sp. TaxID=432653 RepID=UPI00261925C5|nr:helical backbone metal receptor [uncultured Microscilla sp.]